QIQKKRFELIKDADAWRKLWDEHRGTDRSFTETTQTMDVDFDTCRVVCVFCGPSGLAPISGGAVVRGGTIHLRYSINTAVSRGQFRPELFEDKPHDSKAEDIRGYMFVVLPKGEKPIIVQEHISVDYATSWCTRARFPDLDAKKK